VRRGVQIRWLVVGVLASCCHIALGDLAAIVDPAAITGSATGSGMTIGWRFYVDQEITITALGLYDYGDNGLASDHVMGIWRVKKEGGLRLERWIDISGSGDLQTGHHVYVNLANPLTIAPDPVPYISGGHSYYERWVVGVWSPGGSDDRLILYPQDSFQTVASFPIVTDGIIRFENYTYKTVTAPLDTTLGDVTTDPQRWYAWGSTTYNGHFGVNFEYDLNPVPVPGAVVLGICGLGCAGWRLRRRPA
jgi:hypothetical protein